MRAAFLLDPRALLRKSTKFWGGRKSKEPLLARLSDERKFQFIDESFGYARSALLVLFPSRRQTIPRNREELRRRVDGFVGD